MFSIHLPKNARYSPMVVVKAVVVLNDRLEDCQIRSESNDPCSDMDCGFNAHCIGGRCRCYVGYRGDPNVECNKFIEVSHNRITPPQWEFIMQSKTDSLDTTYMIIQIKNSDNYISTETQSVEGCYLPLMTGPRRASVHRLFCNRSTARCEMFHYGGCKENANNFRKKKDCRRICESICLSEHVACMDIAIREEYPRLEHYVHYVPSITCQMILQEETLVLMHNAVSMLIALRAGVNAMGDLVEIPTHCAARKFSQKYTFSSTEIQGEDVCSQPKAPGPCRASIQRYAFNPYIGRCEMFYYGGCQGNGNNFETLEDCQQRCESNTNREQPGHQNGVDVCSLPTDPGPCRGEMRRYAHNPSTRRCEPFTYGGCQGNGNNFETEEECIRRCGGSVTEIVGTQPDRSGGDVCSLPTEMGPCSDYVLRYTFNTSTGRCEMFYYGGCEGNGNRFEKLEDCQQRCESSVSRDPCAGVRCGYNAYCVSGYCYCNQGYEGDANVECQPVSTPERPPQQGNEDICSLPVDSGPCLGSMRHYAYNPSTRGCELFTYGGCQGNANNLEMEEECERRCAGSITSSQPHQSGGDVCRLPTAMGPCQSSSTNQRVALIRFSLSACFTEPPASGLHDPCAGVRCGQNAFCDNGYCYCYQGYEGDPNRECQQAQSELCGGYRCGENAQCVGGLCKCYDDYYGDPLQSCRFIGGDKPSPNPKCRVPIATGNCFARIISYGYNSRTGRCEQFFYTGCLGNENRFETYEECERTCGVWQVKELELVSDCSEDLHGLRYLRAFRPYGGNNCCILRAKNPTLHKPVNIRWTAKDIQTIHLAPDPCKLPLITGPCDGSETRYGYFPPTGRCERFKYSGCGGNENSFATKLECEIFCNVSCSNSMCGENAVCVSGSCVCLQGYKGDPRIYHTWTRVPFKCPKLSVSPAMTAHLRDEICSMPLRTGPCSNRSTRYGYYEPFRKCIKFTYGGCRGTQNNFLTEEDCNMLCEDPCEGVRCGYNAKCVEGRCICEPGFKGDPNYECRSDETDIGCAGVRCGYNARCQDGYCICEPGQTGDPYSECRPDENPCKNVKCAQFAICVNGTCICLPGTIGDPYTDCVPDDSDACQNVRCGYYAKCVNGRCECEPGYDNDPNYKCKHDKFISGCHSPIHEVVTKPNVFTEGVNVKTYVEYLRVQYYLKINQTSVSKQAVERALFVSKVNTSVQRTTRAIQLLNIVSMIAVEELSAVRMHNVLMVDANVSLVTKEIQTENAVQEKTAEDSDAERMPIAEMKFASVKQVTKAILMLDVNE
ncbi:hypothetical protein ACTXT7_010053 [Hymenolepis weldensis]